MDGIAGLTQYVDNYNGYSIAMLIDTASNALWSRTIKKRRNISVQPPSRKILPAGGSWDDAITTESV